MTAAPVTTAASMPNLHLTFGRILRSEWIKLRTLRSTWWCAALILVLNFGLAGLVAAFSNRGGGALPAAALSDLVVTAATLGLLFTQLIAGVLGVLVISGEFGTGMIRSTFAAVPRRSPALAAKAVVLGIAMFVLGIVSIGGGVLIAAPLLAVHGSKLHIDGPFLLALLGGAGYLPLVALLSFGIGAVLRTTAGAIATAMGLLLVLPIVLGGVAAATQLVWAQNVASVLPSAVGRGIYTDQPTAPAKLVDAAGFFEFSNWQSLLILVLWVAVALVGAFALVKRRDA